MGLNWHLIQAKIGILCVSQVGLFTTLKTIWRSYYVGINRLYASKLFDIEIPPSWGLQQLKSLDMNVMPEYSRYSSDLSSAACVVDAGAGVGEYAVYCAKKFGCKVYAFEPVHLRYQAAKELADYNKVDIALFNCGLSDVESIMSVPNGISMAGLGVDNKSAELPLVETRTLDGLNLEKLDVFKIDTEGYELPILKGAMHTITEFKPEVIVEVHGSENKEKVLALLDSIGYKIIYRNRAEKTPYFDTVQTFVLTV